MYKIVSDFELFTLLVKPGGQRITILVYMELTCVLKMLLLH